MEEFKERSLSSQITVGVFNEDTTDFFFLLRYSRVCEINLDHFTDIYIKYIDVDRVVSK